MKYLNLFILILLSSVLIQCDSKEDELSAFKDYIVTHTQINTSIKEPIRIKLVKPVDKFKINEELPEDILEISSKIPGKLWLATNRDIIFQPDQKLKPNTTYYITLHLDKLYDKVKKDFKTYSFKISTIKTDFKVNLESFELYNENLSYRYATIETSDVVNLDDIKKVFKATQNQNKLPLDWSNNAKESTHFKLKIDSIVRYETPSTVQFIWDGKPIYSSNKGENSFSVSSNNDFQVLEIQTPIEGSPRVIVNFSQTLQTKQNLDGLIKIDGNTDLDYDIDNNNLILYPKKTYLKSVNLSIHKNIQSNNGKTLSKSFNESILFNQVKPAIREITKGVILPESTKNPFYFEAIGLKAVDIRIIKVFENNVLQYLQETNIDIINQYQMRKVGRVIARKTIPLVQSEIENDGQWKAYAINLSDFFKAEPSAIYSIDISFRKELSLYNCDSEIDYNFTSIENDEENIKREEEYWNNKYYSWRNRVYDWNQIDNPCHEAYYYEDRFITSNILASNLGLIVKKTNKGDYHFATSNLVTAQPETQVKVKAYNYQMQQIASTTTNNQGLGKLIIEESPMFFVAHKKDQYAYLKLNYADELNLSNFDVSGSKVKEGIKGYLYTERGVYRPGDTIYTTFVMNDIANPLPKDYPVKLQLKDARGKLVYEETKTKGVRKMYAFHLPTKPSAPTGNWSATVHIGAVNFTKNIRVATIKPNRLKIDLKFNEQVLSSKTPIQATLKSQWLSGAKAPNLNAEIEMSITPNNKPFSKYKDYYFYDITRDFNQQTIDFFKGNLNNQGKVEINNKMQLLENVPGMLNLSFLTKVFENGGDFSIDVKQKLYAPFTNFVGLKTPKTSSRTYDTDTETLYDVICLNKEGQPITSKSLKVYIYRLDWRWWWNRGNDNLSKYQNTKGLIAYKEMRIKTNHKGKTQFSINIPEKDRGRYLIRVIDENGNHATSSLVYYYKNWWSNIEGSLSNMLIFTSDKEKYEVGEKATITFPSSQNAKALLSIENGSKVISQKWINTQKGNTTLDIDITEELAPNAYLSISLIQKHQQTANDKPIRLFGVIPLQVHNPNNILNPILETPDHITPENTYDIKVTEQNNLPMTYTLAVVDEGLMDLTNYTVPDIYQFFNQKEALGVTTFDVYDNVIGAYAGSVENIFTIGGGAGLSSSQKRKANRFTPVVSFIGPFTLKSGEERTHQLYMPNYIGSVKAMVVAADVYKENFGSAEKTIPVKKPLMLLASVPRKLSQGEKLSIPLTVFATEPNLTEVLLNVKSGKGLKPIGKTKKTINFNEIGDKIVNFEFEVLSSSAIENLEFFASSGSETAKYTLEIDTYNPNPIAQKTKNFTLEKSKTLEIKVDAFGTEGSNSAFIELSALPPFDVSKRVESLITYPHGCVEQTTSKAFTQIYLEDIAELSFDQKKEIKDNVKHAIEKLVDFQLMNGGISYWPGGTTANDWCSNYVGHFMIEARQQGFELPMTFLSNWKKYQKNQSRNWNTYSYSRNSDYLQAYRLYTLALAGDPDLASMNRLRNTQITNASTWRLAQAYALIGQKDVAQKLISNASLNEVYDSNQHYTFGSKLRNQAMLLESLVYLQNDKMNSLAKDIALKLSSEDWLSTQETAFAILGLSKVLINNGGKEIDILINEENIKTLKPIIKRDITLDQNGKATLQLTNNRDSKLYVRLVQKGKPPLGKSFEESKNLNIAILYEDTNGDVLDINKIKQGTEINAVINIKNRSQTNLKNIALQYHLPSGWEIIDNSYTNYKDTNYSQADYVDIRDNEMRFYLDLKSLENKTFVVKMNVSYLGEYFLPGSQAETMYSKDYFARTKDRKIKVIP